MINLYNTTTKEFTNSIEVKTGRVYPSSTEKDLPVYNSENQKVIFGNGNWKTLSLKEFTEHLISIGEKTIEATQKINDAGEVVEMEFSEKLASGLIPIADAKQHYKELAKQKESEKVNSGFTYNENLIDSDEKAQNFISALLIAVNAGLVTELKGFTTKDNKDINLTASDITSIAGFCLAHVANCHAWKRDLYSKIEIATKLEELKAIDLLLK